MFPDGRYQTISPFSTEREDEYIVNRASWPLIYTHLSPSYLKEAIKQVSSFWKGNPTEKVDRPNTIKNDAVSISTVAETG